MKEKLNVKRRERKRKMLQRKRLNKSKASRKLVRKAKSNRGRDSHHLKSILLQRNHKQGKRSRIVLLSRKLVVRHLMILMNAVFVSGHMKKMRRNVQGLNGYNVFVQDGSMKSVSQKL